MKPARIAKLMAQLLAVTTGIAATATASAIGREAQLVIGRVLAPPVIKGEPGFKAKLLVPPGELYDPLFMVPRDGTVWMNDDGQATDGHGSRGKNVERQRIIGDPATFIDVQRTVASRAPFLE